MQARARVNVARKAHYVRVIRATSASSPACISSGGRWRLRHGWRAPFRSDAAGGAHVRGSLQRWTSG